MDFLVEPSGIDCAVVAVPGDKSISHRALMLGAIAQGTSEISGFLPGEDCLATLRALQAMGVVVKHHSATQLSVTGPGVGGLAAPECELDLGNSGTAMRLMAGLLAGQRFATTLTGDESLSARPMARVIRPLKAMGARIDSRDGKPPLTIHGRGGLRPIDYVLPMASAQVKSAILLAGLYASGTSRVTEPAVTRDHTERMLSTMGVELAIEVGAVSIDGPQTPTATAVRVPADISSAMFPLLAALLAEQAEIVLPGVGVNPTRTGALDILHAMGARIDVENPRQFGAEPVADLRVRSSELAGQTVDPALVSRAIDEFPALFVAAAAARGKTVFSGLEELRVKESDRIATMVAGLARLGIRVEQTRDGAVIHGGRFSGGDVHSGGDHRVAMALAVAGTRAAAAVRVRDVAAVDTSFPGFRAVMATIGARIALAGGAAVAR